MTPDPVNPGWDLVTYYQDSPLDRDGNLVPTEYVYVLVNKSMPDMVKIGMTVREVEERAKEISGATGVPTPFKLEYIFRCSNGMELESEIHRHLKEFRPNNQREFFDISLDKAMEAVKFLGSNHN